ncbi:MAG: ATP-binding cassette domain-containing protein [Negativicutes bacterium]
MEIIRFDHVGLKIKESQILDNVSFSTDPGEIVGIAGPSGSGKTSLLRLMNLLRSPTTGTIFYKDHNVIHYDPAQLRREVGYVLQKPYLFDGTVQDNLEYPYHVWNQKPDMIEARAYLERVNLPASILVKRKTEMSGGEQQRIALVRSLLAKPQVLLLDEVTASLDEENTLVLEKLILEEWAARSLTVFFISHHSEQLQRMAKNIISLDRGQLEYQGPVGEFFQLRGGLNNE